MSENQERALTPEDEYGSPGGENGADPNPINLDLTRQELHRGVRSGESYVRLVRPYGHLFQRVGPGYLRATEEAQEPKTRLQHFVAGIKRIVVGEPLPTRSEVHQRLTKVKALAIFASDAMSSVAYATEEILFVLVAAGSSALGYSVPISLAIALLISVVAFSYRQTVFAYPGGGGSYIVSKENIGTLPGLVAAAALMLDYILTVAVSISAGTAALTSAFNFLLPYTVPIALAFIAVMVFGNLRGIRESGNIFAVPTYAFIVSLAILIVVGVFRWVTNQLTVEPVGALPMQGTEPVTFWLLLTAFSAGSVAASGIEAISNGVPAFKRPEPKNAATTLTVMATILGVFFLGISLLAWHWGLAPQADETIVSQLGRGIFGRNFLYYFLQFATMAILVLAANTSFNGFPPLASILARDGFLPHHFSYRGDRLAFSTGIVVLGLIAAVLIVAFGGDTHLLIPLYAVGVFLAFTMSQTGMVLHHWRVRERGWQRNMLINGFGALLTAVVLAIAAATKFTRGAWIIIILIPILVWLFLGVDRYYRSVAAKLKLPDGDNRKTKIRQIVLVPLADLTRASERALAFAHSIAKQVNVIHLTESEKEAEEFRDRLQRFDPDVNLVLLESPYRTLIDPLLTYIDALHQQDSEAFITIILPEFVISHWWQRFLHNRTADRLNRALKPHPNVAVVNVPYVLEQ